MVLTDGMVLGGRLVTGKESNNVTTMSGQSIIHMGPGIGVCHMDLGCPYSCHLKEGLVQGVEWNGLSGLFPMGEADLCCEAKGVEK